MSDLSMQEAFELDSEFFAEALIEASKDLKGDREMYKSKRDFYNQPLVQKPFHVLKSMARFEKLPKF